MSIYNLKETENFSDRLRAARLRHGYSQEELADKLGVSNGAVGNWETGPTIPRPQMLRKIEELLGVKIEQLLGGYPESPERNRFPRTSASPGTSHYSWMETVTLEHILSDLAARLPKAAAQERPHIIANLADVINQLALREQRPPPASDQTSEAPPLIEPQKTDG
jgi:transcriptional regulator with XRE-family HTH domain